MVILCPLYNLKTVQDIFMKLCIYACNNDTQLVWVNFLYVSDSQGETYVVFFC